MRLLDKNKIKNYQVIRAERTHFKTFIEETSSLAGSQSKQPKNVILCEFLN